MDVLTIGRREGGSEIEACLMLDECKRWVSRLSSCLVALGNSGNARQLYCKAPVCVYIYVGVDEMKN